MPDLWLGCHEEADRSRDPLTHPDQRVSSGTGFVTASGVVVVFEHEVPTVETVLAAVRDHVAFEPHTVLTGRCQQKATATTVDAGDLGSGFEHASSMPTGGTP